LGAGASQCCPGAARHRPSETRQLRDALSDSHAAGLSVALPTGRAGTTVSRAAAPGTSLGGSRAALPATGSSAVASTSIWVFGWCCPWRIPDSECWLLDRLFFCRSHRPRANRMALCRQGSPRAPPGADAGRFGPRRPQSIATGISSGSANTRQSPGSRPRNALCQRSADRSLPCTARIWIALTWAGWVRASSA
jgi:hypothetical protein